MNIIRCPHCNQEFEIDDSSYASILNQIRTHEFDKEVHEKIEQAEEQHKKDIKLLEQQYSNQTQQEIAKKDAEIQALKITLNNKDNEAELKKKAELAQLEIKKNTEIDAIKTDLNDEITKKTNRINLLAYEVSAKEEEIERLKEMKTMLSTKMVGESLEQHCEIEFNKLRATGFKNAYFEKDNKVSESGSKGDYIFREADDDGTEIVSIMFEMKNENETTATKHKNEDFLKELDKDRNEKKCEYAVLVSLLESDNDLYNSGIVDMSHRYPKMYVIRPQFFVPMITLLRNAALNSLQYKKDLIAIKNQDIDIANFENDMNEWKMSWFNTMKNAGKKHMEAIEQIEKAIKDLEKTRDALILSDKHLNSAENKLEDLTIKRLTKNNPTMAEKFEKLNPQE